MANNDEKGTGLPGLMINVLGFLIIIGIIFIVVSGVYYIINP
jgi:hypothetical protein